MASCSCEGSDCSKLSIVEDLVGLYETFGSSEYIGEKVTQVQHALQASDAAEKGYPDEV